MANHVLGYNVLFKVGGKVFAGTTSDTLNVNPTVKDSITKDNQGSKEYSVVGNEVQLDFAGLCVASLGTGETTTKRIDALDLALVTGSDAVLAVTYVSATGDTYTGSGVITSYKEESGAEDNATYSGSCKVWNFAKTTGGSSM